MTARGYASIALGCVLAFGLAACGDEESPEARVAYTASPSAEVPPANEGTDSSVATIGRPCLSNSHATINAPIPTEWDIDKVSVDKCAWSSGDATITLVYGKTPSDDYDAWKRVVDQHRSAELEDTIPGYRFTRYTENEGGGPLWHYRYVDGGVYMDSLNLYRGGWQITYEAESTNYNTYLADQLIDNTTLA